LIDLHRQSLTPSLSTDIPTKYYNIPPTWPSNTTSPWHVVCALMRYLRVCNIYFNNMRSAAGLAQGRADRSAYSVVAAASSSSGKNVFARLLRTTAVPARRQRPCFALRRNRTRAHSLRVVRPNGISLKFASVVAVNDAHEIIYYNMRVL